MPTMQFSLSSFTNKNADLKAGNAFSAYAFGDGVANALMLAVRLTLNNIRVYSSQCYLDLSKGSGTGRTANFAQNSAIHNQTVAMSEFSHALIQTGAGDITFTVRASGGSTGNLINLRDNVSGVLEIDYFIPQSDFTLDKSELDAGQTITATITPTHPDADHEIIWRFQTAHKDYSSVQSDSASYTAPFTKALAVPLSWLDAIPNTESGLATCTVNTYMNGVLTGVVTKQFTIMAGADILPSIASLSAARINNGVPSGWAEYVQGISGVQLTANGVNGIYDSTIVEVKTTGAGYTGTSNPYSTGPINAVGDVTFTCTVKDSRGRTKSAAVMVTFRPYEPPRFTSIDTIRCNEDGTPNDSGTYVKVTVTYTYASVNGKNGISAMETSRRLYTGGSYTQLSTVIAASGAPYVAGNGFSAASSYVVKVTIADGLFAVDTTDIVPTESWLLHYRVGGRGVAIGMIAQLQDAFEVNPLWEIYYKGMTLDERFGGIEIPNIWPITAGGTGADTAYGARQNLQITPQNIGALALTNGGNAQVVDSPMHFRSSYGIRARHIDGSTSDGMDGVLLLNYGNAGKPVIVSTSLDIATPLGITSGGTGAADAANARMNLEVPVNKAYANLSALDIPNLTGFFRTADAARVGFKIQYDNNYAVEMVHDYSTENYYLRNFSPNAWGPWRKIYTSADVTPAGSPTVGGPASLLMGFTAGNGSSPINPDNIIQNGLYYVNGINLFGQIDGACYAQGYSNQWMGEIFQDYRTGQLAIRGKQNNAWQPWRSILDSSNYTEHALPKVNPVVNGTLQVNPGATAGYTEGIRIARSTGGWSFVSVGASESTSGSVAGQWLFATGPDASLQITKAGNESSASNGISIAADNSNMFFNTKRVYHAGNITNGQASPPSNMAEGDIYLQW